MWVLYIVVGYIILLYFLYYFNVLYVKNRTFDVKCVVKWVVKIDKVSF